MLTSLDIPVISFPCICCGSIVRLEQVFMAPTSMVGVFPVFYMEEGAFLLGLLELCFFGQPAQDQASLFQPAQDQATLWPMHTKLSLILFIFYYLNVKNAIPNTTVLYNVL
ncbi:hypothetical protein SAY87_000179 [Trapa incisa]|uniref:Uncharacterized protein n=1 Tax=Trapa incisa TaxID=236973 RepID=A0AAN7JGZ3_9MYRT|nr:hypothetical protein SAY87_000179 [Trapa incisa]